MFNIYIPETLEFRDYINICQVARTWADGYDKKDKERLLASLAPNLTVDYTGVVPAWGSKQVSSRSFLPLYDTILPDSGDERHFRRNFPEVKDEIKKYIDAELRRTSQYTATEFADEWLSPQHLGLKPLATQHFLGLHYFKSVTETEVVVEWQQIASHGRRAAGEDFTNPMCKIQAESNHRSFMEHRFVKLEGKGWKIEGIRPSVIYQPGDFMDVRRAE